MRWAPEGLALRNQPLRQISQLVWIHPGEGPPGRLCMTWRNYRCEVGGEQKSVCSKFGRRDCPGRLRDLLRKSCFPKGSNGHALHWFGVFGYRGPKRAGITFPLSNGPIVTGAKYPVVIRCPEHDCDAVYTCTSRNPLGLPVETG